MTRERLELGAHGEALAYRKIQCLGYKKIVRNYRCSLGELDLVAEDGDTLVFIEIKTRRGRPTSFAKEAVTARKRRKLSALALAYMKAHNCMDMRARFDVIAISLDSGPPQIELIQNAFELAWDG